MNDSKLYKSEVRLNFVLFHYDVQESGFEVYLYSCVQDMTAHAKLNFRYLTCYNSTKLLIRIFPLFRYFRNIHHRRNDHIRRVVTVMSNPTEAMTEKVFEEVPIEQSVHTL